MNKNLLEAQDIFLNRVNQICNKFGLNNMMAQLYAILYLSNKPLSLNDMVERLKISKGSVSTNIRVLERYGAVRRVWIKGSRRDYYEAEVNIAKVIIERIRSMGWNRLVEVNEMIDSSYQTLNSFNASDRNEDDSIIVFKERLKKLKSLHTKAKNLFNLLDSGFLSNINIMDLKVKRNNKNTIYGIKE